MDGPTHVMPHPAPGWMGPVGPHIGGPLEEGASGNANPHGDDGAAAGDVEMQNVQAEVADDEIAQDDGQLDGSARTCTDLVLSGVGLDFAASGGIQSSIAQPLEPPSFGNQVIDHLLTFISPAIIDFHTFANLSIFIIVLSTKVPSYIIDESILWYLANVVVGTDELVTEQGLIQKKTETKMDEVMKGTDEAEGDDDVRIIPNEDFTQRRKNPRKRRAKKLCAPLSAEFVMCSRRLNKDLDGFRNKELKLALDEGSMKVGGLDAESSDDEGNVKTLMPTPLAMVPATDEAPVFFKPRPSEQAEPAPFLSVENVQAMAIGFLNMQPGTVSSAALFEYSDEE